MTKEHQWYKVFRGQSFGAGESYRGHRRVKDFFDDRPPWEPLRVISDERFQANLRFMQRKVTVGVVNTWEKKYVVVEPWEKNFEGEYGSTGI